MIRDFVGTSDSAYDISDHGIFLFLPFDNVRHNIVIAKMDLFMLRPKLMVSMTQRKATSSSTH